MRNSQTVVVMTKYFFISFFSSLVRIDNLVLVYNKSVFFILFLFSNKIYNWKLNLITFQNIYNVFMVSNPFSQY